MRRFAVVAVAGFVAAAWIVAASGVPVDQDVPTSSPTVIGAESRAVERPRRQETPLPVRVAVERFLIAFTLYEVGRGGRRSRTAFRRHATRSFARELLRDPPRVARGVERASVRRVVLGRVRRRRATAVATLARGNRVFALVVVLEHGGRAWRVAEVRR
jgi:hypothetical protein